MSIRREPTKDGVKLRDTDNGLLVGSVGAGKDKVPVAPSRPATPVQPQAEEDTIASAHKKYLSKETERPNQSTGNAEVALKNEILRTIVGSEVAGMAIPGRGDRDEMGIYVETPAQLIGLEPNSEQYTSRSVPEGERSKPGDLDLTIYSLRKYMSLAVAGNPSILTPLFAPVSSIVHSSLLGDELRALASDIVSVKAGWRHLGYLDSQRERMTGEGKQNRVPSRPELIEAFGYDVKYASHALRLGLQGIELMTRGRLALPMEDDNLARCMRVKTGEVGFEVALQEVDNVRAELFSIMESRRYLIQTEPNMTRINEWMVSASRRHWGW